MKQAIAALSGSGATLFACYAFGSYIVGKANVRLDRLENLFLAFLVGASVLHLAVFALLTFHLAYWPLLVIMLAVAAGLGIHSGDWLLPPPPPSSWPKSITAKVAKYCFILVASLFFSLYFINAWAPEHSPDGATYHLGLVARYLRAHGFERVPTTVFSNLSGGIEMLYVPAFAIGRHSAAALVHLGFLIACSIGIFAYGKRINKPLIGAAAALMFFVSPVVGVDASSAYNDVAAASVIFSVFYWLEIWDAERNPRILVIIGLLSGYCYAVKYTIFVMGLYAIGFVLWRSKKIRPAAIVASCAFVMVAPWMIKNWIYTNNPVSPLANQYFRNPYVTVDFERHWRELNAHYNLKSLWDLPLDVTARGKFTGGMLGVIFLAAPLALLSMRQHAGRRLLAALTLLFVTYFTNIGARFVIPMLPLLSLAMALAAEAATPVLVVAVLLHSALSWPSVVRSVYNPTWYISGFPYEAALRLISPDAYLNQFTEYRQARLIEHYVPRGGRVLTFDNVPDAYTTREIMVSYQSAFGEEMAGLIYLNLREPKSWGRVVAFTFPQQQVRHLRLTQVARVERLDDQWDVQELQFYRAQKEVPKESSWRWDAFPFPWGVTNAIDNSLATKWQTWETAAPGQYISVDFQSLQIIDEVRVHLLDAWSTKMRIETQNAQGRWIPLPAETHESSIDAPESLHKSIASELHSRGVDFVLFKDDNYGAQKFAAEPEHFGLTLLTHESEASLYRVNP
jgi:hypothetical protein